LKVRKTLLVVNYDFPPAGGAGIKRCLKFMKYLPEYGWDCVVLTVKDGNHTVTDASLLGEVWPGVPVYRVFSFESFFTGHKDSSQYGTAQKSVAKHAVKKLMRLCLGRIYKFFGQFIRIPDSRILWVPGAILTSVRIMWKNRFDAIYATGPTFTNLLLGVLIKTISRKPLLVDFRDAWISDPMLVLNQGKGNVLKISAMLEKFVVVHADRVVTTNPFVTKDFQRRYSQFPSTKYDTIYNGYDSNDFKFVRDVVPRESKKFTIVYTGILYGERTPKYFLEALRRALDERPDILSKVQVLLVGKCQKFLDGKRIEDYLDEYHLKDTVQLTGHVSRIESLTYQAMANMLLLIVGIVPKEMGLTYGLSGKVFDYILAQKPILTVADGGSTREFIEENGIGRIFYHKDAEGIKNYLIEAYEKYTDGIEEPIPDTNSCSNFEFSALTKRMANHLNEILTD
jgi:glycosyltransferase involved in cell wall biosynthesis